MATERLSPGAGWQWHGPLERGKAVEIRGVTGNIHAAPSESGEVEVSAVIEKEGVAETVVIRAIENRTGMTFCAVRHGSSACDTDALTSPGARVDYEVRLPVGVKLSAHTVNGEIQARALDSDVEADTVNGAVVVSTSGTVQARTVNGPIDASLLQPCWTKAPEFSAVNGKIMVSIPRTVNSNVRAETRNGKIVADLPKFHGTSTEQSLQGHIGPAGRGNLLLIRTVNGTIELRQKF